MPVPMLEGQQVRIPKIGCFMNASSTPAALASAAENQRTRELEN
jgi:hypothetical protein